MKKALITGAAGFVGSHLVEYLLIRKISVTVVVHPNNSLENLNSTINKIKIYKEDLTNKKAFNGFINEDYDYVFHLAAFSSPAKSFKNPQETIKNNVFAQLYLLQSLAKKKSKSRILIVGSADEYGDVKSSDLPVDENTPLEPTSPYAISKVAQDLLGYQFFLNNKLHIVRVRPFNHIGPRQSKSFVVPSFASQIAKIEKNGKGSIKVGNINNFRDFTDVRDMVRAYHLALEKGKTGDVYNIGSGKVYKISDILNTLLSFSTAKIKVIKDLNKVRKTDIKKIYCNFDKFKRDTNWTPKIDINNTLFDTIEYERKILK